MLDELIKVVGRAHVLTEPADLRSYAGDQGPFPNLMPLVVARPACPDEVAAIMRLANQYHVPVVPRGGGYSLMGFPPVTPSRSIFIDLRRLDRILDIDEVNRTVTAEGGIIMSALDAAVRSRGLEVPTVAVPIRYTTLGGVLSGVVGGGLPRNSAVVGTNAHAVLGLSVVLGDGSALETNAGGSNVHRARAVLPDADGPTLTPLFLGDGGVLGIKVAATLSLTPVADHVDAGAWLFADFDDAWLAVSRLTDMHYIPYAALRAAAQPKWSLSFTAQDSTARALRDRVALIEAVMRATGGTPADDGMRDAARAMSTADRRWVDRFLEVDRALLAFIFGNREFPEAFRQVRELIDRRFEERGLADRGLRTLTYFRPHTRRAAYTTISIVYDSAVPGGREHAAELSAEAHSFVVELGGHIEPHQGAGSQILGDAWSPAYRRVVAGLKQMTDPNNILNPGLWGMATRA